MLKRNILCSSRNIVILAITHGTYWSILPFTCFTKLVFSYFVVNDKFVIVILTFQNKSYNLKIKYLVKVVSPNNTKVNQKNAILNVRNVYNTKFYKNNNFQK